MDFNSTEGTTLRRTLTSLASSLAVLAIVSGVVAASCPYPLGDFINRADFATHGGGSDPERQVVEATIIHGQKSFGQVVNVRGELHFIYNAEVEYELPGGGEGETHSIFYKKYSNQTGWNVTIEHLASEDTTVEMPDGRNVQPFAVARGDELWTTWEVSGAVRFQPNGSYVLMRGKTPAGWTPIVAVSPTDTESANKIPRAIAIQDNVFIAYQTNSGEADSGNFRLVGRMWDGAALGPIENISQAGDGWSDQVVALATDGSRIFAVWASQDASEFTGLGDWVVKVAVRDPSGAWGPEVALSDANNVRTDYPAAEWHDGKLIVAWSTSDPDLPGPAEFKVVMRTYNPVSAAAGELVLVNPSDFRGLNSYPWLYSWGGKLHILWASNTYLQGTVPSPNTDIYYRTWGPEGFGPVRAVSDLNLTGFVDIYPGFFLIGDTLYAYFLANICLPGCGHETDWREMTRLLERPARGYDDLHANYTLDSRAFIGNGTVIASIRFTHADGSPAPADDYAVIMSNGTIVRLPPRTSTAAVSLPFTDNVFLPPDVRWCGKPIASTEGIPAVPSKVSPADGLAVSALLGAAALAGLAGFLGRRARRD